MIADLQRQLGIDSTFFLQLIVFLFIFSWLQLVYFKPFLQLIQARERQSDGLADEARKLEEAAARAEQEYSDAIRGARKRAAAERELILAGARKRASEQVSAAREAAKEQLEQARQSSARSAETELANLSGQVGPVAALLVERLTKAKVGL